MATERATRAADLVDTFGVVAHINFTDGVYAPIEKVIDAFEYLGVDHVRARAPNPSYALVGQKNLAAAADAGLKFVFHPIGSENPSTVVKNLHAFEDVHPGSVIGIEGLNEVNNFEVAYKGMSGTAAAKLYQSDLFNGVNADPLLRAVPVLGFTDYPHSASASDWSNEHIYPKNGDQSYGAVVGTKTRLTSLEPNKPFAITEMGYHNSLGADTGGGWEGVDRPTQAKLSLNAYMDAAVQGSRGTYLYQLLDSPSNGSGADQENNFGLFDAAYKPKPVATAIHNLTSILQDSDSAASTFTSGSLSYTATGLPLSAHDYLTQKADGTFQIVFWAEPDIWNQANDKPIAAATQTVTLKFDEAITTIEIYDPLIGSAATKTIQNATSVTFTLSDHPIVIDVNDVDPKKPGMGNDTYVVAAIGQVISEAAGGGVDTVRTSLSNYSLAENVENLVYTGTTGFNGKGNGSANAISSGSGADTLNGGHGPDTLTGASGNDTYIVDDVGDKLIELLGGGTDKVSSSVDYRLGVNIENLTLTSGAHLDGFGNELANSLTGTTGNNMLSGGLGSDRLTGLLGNDLFVFNTTLGKNNVDTIVDFGSITGNDDRISLDHSIFDDAGAVNVLRKAAFAANVTGVAAERDDRIVYETDTGNLYYDPDGSLALEQVQFARLATNLNLTYLDFIIA